MLSVTTCKILMFRNKDLDSSNYQLSFYVQRREKDDKILRGTDGTGHSKGIHSVVIIRAVLVRFYRTGEESGTLLQCL